jgi:hypothetical protein
LINEQNDKTERFLKMIFSGKSEIREILLTIIDKDDV